MKNFPTSLNKPSAEKKRNPFKPEISTPNNNFNEIYFKASLDQEEDETSTIYIKSEATNDVQEYLGIGDIINTYSAAPEELDGKVKNLVVVELPKKYKEIVTDTLKNKRIHVSFEERDTSGETIGSGTIERASYLATQLIFNKDEIKITEKILDSINYPKDNNADNLIICPNNKREIEHFSWSTDEWKEAINLWSKNQKKAHHITILPHFDEKNNRDIEIEEYCTKNNIPVYNLHQVFKKNEWIQETQQEFGEHRDDLCSIRQLGALANVLGHQNATYLSNDSAPIHIISAAINKKEDGTNISQVISVNTNIPEAYCPRNGGISFPLSKSSDNYTNTPPKEVINWIEQNKSKK